MPPAAGHWEGGAHFFFLRVAQGLRGFGLEGLGFRGWGFRGLGFRVSGFGFRVSGLRGRRVGVSCFPFFEGVW